MTFKLSQRSLDRLEGVDTRMVAVVKMAINLTKTDLERVVNILIKVFKDAGLIK